MNTQRVITSWLFIAETGAFARAKASSALVTISLCGMPVIALRRLVLLNAGLSLGSGLLLASVPAAVGRWLGVDAHGWLRLIGFALALHGLMLAWASAQQDLTVWARVNVWAITPYPVIVVGLVVFDVIRTDGGRVLALIDGAIVAALAFGQARLVARNELKSPC